MTNAGLPTRFGRVEARNYLAYLLWVVPGAAGMLLLGVAILMSAFPDKADAIGRGIGTVGLSVFLAAWPLALVHVVVNATNRPRFLVPPPYRDQAGEVAAMRRRRARKSAGLPPTDHLVDIIEVPDDGGGPPWLMAQCSEPECDWYGDVDPALGSADAEDELRAKAREHTGSVAEQVVRPAG